MPAETKTVWEKGDEIPGLAPTTPSVPAKRQNGPPKINCSPSGSDMWCDCTMQPVYCFDNWDRIPPQDTEYSQEGVTAHEVFAAQLLGRPIDPKACPVPHTPEMLSHAWDYEEYITALRNPGSKLIVEQKLPLWYMKGRNGYVDAAVLNFHQADSNGYRELASLDVIDAKYGAGVLVSPVKKKQLVCYAKILGNSLNRKLRADLPVTLHIFQPTHRNAEENGPASKWETTWGEIEDIAFEIQNVAIAIQSRSGLKFSPSEKTCQFCPAKGFCMARQDSVSDGLEPLTLQPNNRPGGFPPAPALTIEQQAKVVQYAGQIRSWLKGVETHVSDSMKAGVTYPGLKLVTGRDGNRYWTDEDQAAAMLRKMGRRDDEIFEPRTLLGPAPIEKLVGRTRFKDNLGTLIGRKPGQPKVVVDSDERESLDSELMGDFEALDGDFEVIE